MKPLVATTLAAFALLVAGQHPVARTQDDAVFTPEEFFAVPVAGAGTITTLFFWDKQFSNAFSSRITGSELLIEETFAFPDAAPRQYWRLNSLGDGRYDGDVTTQGEDGRMRGPVQVTGWLDPDGFHLDYAGYAPDGGDTKFRFRHHLAPQPDGTVVNTVSVSWWGLPLATSKAVFSRQPPG